MILDVMYAYLNFKIEFQNMFSTTQYSSVTDKSDMFEWSFKRGCQKFRCYCCTIHTYLICIWKTCTSTRLKALDYHFFTSLYSRHFFCVIESSVLSCTMSANKTCTLQGAENWWKHDATSTAETWYLQ